MHFSIPKAALVLEAGKDGYVSYDVHVNGLYHCSCRYRKLLELHEKLKRCFGPGVAATFPSFPPKRFLPLSDQQLEQRRSQLEKYLQLVSQIPRVRHSEQFCSFLVEAQLESYEKEVTLGDREGSSSSLPGGGSPPYLEVEAMNGTKTCVTMDQNDRGTSTENVLGRVCEELKLPRYLHSYFRLVVAKRDVSSGRVSLVRILEDYEAPWITMRRMDGNLKVIIRKRYWDPDMDAELLRDPVGLNLRYCEAVTDVEHDWCPVPPNVLAHLTQMQARGSKRQYLDLVRTQKYYGYWRFGEEPCVCDYPKPGTRVVVRIGQKELVTESLDKTAPINSVFRVTRMRCWRISGILPEVEASRRRATVLRLNGNDDDDYGGGASLEEDDESSDCSPPIGDLSFEYLVGRDKMDWITIRTPQAILISLCLQSMVDELLEKQKRNVQGADGSSEEEPKPQEQESRIARWLENKFAKRESNVAGITNGNAAAVSSSSTRNAFVQNAVFHEIGDEDL